MGTGSWVWGIALPLEAALGATVLSFPPYSFGTMAAGWYHFGTRLKFTILSQGQLPAGWERSPGSLPLPWHTGAQRLCYTSLENGPLGQHGRYG